MALRNMIQRSTFKAAILLAALALSCRPAAALDDGAQPETALAVEVMGGLLSIEAEQVPRQVLLERVSEAGAFRLDIRGDVSDDDVLSASVQEQPIQDAISWLVGKHAYALIERTDPENQSSPALLLVLFDQELGASAPLPPAASVDPADPTDAASALIEALATDDQEERLTAVAKAKLFPAGDALAVLKAALEPERDRKTKSRAIAALLRLKSPEAEAMLREIVFRGENNALRIQAIHALSTRLGADAVGFLDDILKDETRNRIRLAALSSLQRIGSDDARASIEFILSDDDARIRAAAKRALDGKDVILKRRRRY